jgi:hypothetical protein
MKRNLFIFCLSFLAIQTFAQKLPDQQETSLSVPANIRVDGKSTEWNDTYAAQNRRTELFYSMANDDKNLYLIIKSSSSANINKIMLGGITFTVNNEGKKREKDAIAVTYPLISRNNSGFGGRGQGQQRPGNGMGGIQNRAQLSQEQRDSLAILSRKAMLAKVKEIKICGITSIPDSLISIYNEYGIKAVASFDAKGAFVYELAIPLNLLKIAATTQEIAYQIKLNGLNSTGFVGNWGDGNGNRGNGFGVGGDNFQDLMSPTDFWGKYTLVKK